MNGAKNIAVPITNKTENVMLHATTLTVIWGWVVDAANKNNVNAQNAMTPIPLQSDL